MKKNVKDDRGVAGFLGEQRTQLEGLRAHLLRRNGKVDRDLRREDGSAEADFEEQATARENDEVLVALSGEGRDQLALVEAALGRLDAGTYGHCERCAKKIERPRLKACPYATTCLECARKTPAS
jgi:RNA polymerase-binding transcription factor DksA